MLGPISPISPIFQLSSWPKSPNPPLGVKTRIGCIWIVKTFFIFLLKTAKNIEKIEKKNFF